MMASQTVRRFVYEFSHQNVFATTEPDLSDRLLWSESGDLRLWSATCFVFSQVTVYLRYIMRIVCIVGTVSR